MRAAAGRPLPRYVQEEFKAYLKCGRFEHGFLRVRCEDCRAEKLVAFNCKRRGFCPSCGTRRMTESAALLADEVMPRKPLRQWVLSLPFALRFLLATYPEALTLVLGIVYRTISTHVLRKTRPTRVTGATGAVTLIRRFGSALNLNIHFHLLVRDVKVLALQTVPARLLRGAVRYRDPPRRGRRSAAPERRLSLLRALCGSGFARRQRGPRRGLERHPVMTDWYQSHWLAVTEKVLPLSRADALLTLELVSRGADGINPLMEPLVEGSGHGLAFWKLVLTSMGVVALTMVERLRILAASPWAAFLA